MYTFSPLIIHQLLKRLFDKREALKILRTNSSEEVFQISKALDGQRVATHNFESKIAIISKTHRKEGSSPEAKQQGRKRNIAFRGTIPALSVYYKRGLNEKVESHTKPTTTLTKF